MEEMTIQEQPGFFSKVARVFTRTEAVDDYQDTVDISSRINRSASKADNLYDCTVTVRRQISSFEDAMAAANGLKRGELQILNLAGTDSVTREKIVDFMCGVNFAEEGTWQEIGDCTYLIAPPNTHVDVAPATPRINSLRN